MTTYCTRRWLAISTTFLSMIARAPSSTLFPYTTLFRSGRRADGLRRGAVPPRRPGAARGPRQSLQETLRRSEEHTSELQSHSDLVCRLLLEKKKKAPAERLRPARNDLAAVRSTTLVEHD